MVEADESAAELEEGEMNISSSLVAHHEPAVLTQPRQGALHHPPVLAQLLRALYPLACNPHLDVSPAKCLPASGTIVRLVRVQLLGTLPWSASRSLDRLDAIQELLKHHGVVPVRTRDHHMERYTLAVDHNMALCAGALWAFPRSVGFGPVCAPPFLPGHSHCPGSLAPNLSGLVLPAGL